MPIVRVGARMARLLLDAAATAAAAEEVQGRAMGRDQGRARRGHEAATAQPARQPQEAPEGPRQPRTVVLMSWYTVTKRIKGRSYLYLQMTYRVGGKVKTKNKYLGPAVADRGSFGVGAPASLPIAATKSTPPTPNTRPPQPIIRSTDLSTAAYARHLKESTRLRRNDWRRADREYDRATMSAEDYKSQQRARSYERLRRASQRLFSSILPDIGQARTADRFAQQEKEAVETTTSQNAPSEATPSAATAASAGNSSDPQPGSC